MAASAAQIVQMRRMTGETTTANYLDIDIQSYIETYPLIDPRGEEPYTWDTSTEPPTKEDNDNWIETYDLHAAAADIWEEKAAVVASRFDFMADGGNYSRSQEYEHYMKQARYHRSRRSFGTITTTPWPSFSSVSEIGNLPEPD